MRRPTAAWSLLLMLAAGCDGLDPVSNETDTEAMSGGGNPGSVLLLAAVSTEGPCNTVGVTGVQLVARRVGCEAAPPAPCTLPAEPPTLEGDAFSCPASDPSRLLGVEVDEGGRYEVQSVIEFTTGEREARCHVEGGNPEVLVTSEAVEAGMVRMLDDGEQACP
ncbi:MAG: hypothetical protein ACE37F_27575 [Nannocystaceae bacterium]|nr:hypothetical protein [bacterium]